jgi:predicted  nucleic acid-binding Zn-ribbon protein
MKAKELQAENEALKAQVMGLSSTLKSAEEKIQFLESEIQGIFKQKQDLAAELNHYIMLNNTTNKNQNDSRYY